MLTTEELKQLAHSTSNARLRTRYLAAYHFSRGYNRTAIAEMLGASRTSVNAWISAYLNSGIDGLQSKKYPGRPTQLTDKQIASLKSYVEKNAVKEDGGRLIAEDVRQYIIKTFQIEYQLSNIYRLLRAIGFSWITSRSRHPKQSKEAQELFKKPSSGNDPSHTGAPTA